jgi:hypothetical protein
MAELDYSSKSVVVRSPKVTTTAPTTHICQIALSRFQTWPKWPGTGTTITTETPAEWLATAVQYRVRCSDEGP